MTHTRLLCIAFSIVALSACTAEETSTAGGVGSTIATSNDSDPLTGMWTGEWGSTPEQRNPVTVALTWEGTNLSGTVNPGSEAAAITKGTFAPDTGMVMLEAVANSTGGAKPTNYKIEGKLAAGSITGTWIENDKKGDFKITKS